MVSKAKIQTLASQLSIPCWQPWGCAVRLAGWAREEQGKGGKTEEGIQAPRQSALVTCRTPGADLSLPEAYGSVPAQPAALPCACIEIVGQRARVTVAICKLCRGTENTYYWVLSLSVHRRPWPLLSGWGWDGGWVWVGLVDKIQNSQLNLNFRITITNNVLIQVLTYVMFETYLYIF